MKGSEAFKQTIKSYLEERGSRDPLFAKIVLKPGKNMDDCITYILNTVQKSDCNGFTDDEVYNMAIHYFDEDILDIGSARDMRVVVNHQIQLTEAEKAKGKEDAMKRFTENEQVKLQQAKLASEEKAKKAIVTAEEKRKEKEKNNPNKSLFDEAKD
jgi:hypothetical protein